jgi:hypothetical protein
MSSRTIPAIRRIICSWEIEIGLRTDRKDWGMTARASNDVGRRRKWFAPLSKLAYNISIL